MFWLKMNTPPPDPATPLSTGDPTRPFLSIADPAARLEAARRAQRLAEAKNLSRRYVLLATGFALLPLPLVDIAAVLALQVKLVHDLSHLYGVPFESGMAKPLLTSLLSCGAVSGGGLALMGLGLTIPGLRTLIGGGFSGSLAGTTLATSEIFIRHFEAGGTMADFDPHPAQLAPAPAPSSPPQAEADLSQSPAPPAVAVEQHPSPQPASPIAEPPITETLTTGSGTVGSSLVDSSLTNSSTSDQLKPIDLPTPDAEASESPLCDLERIYGIGTTYRDRLFAAGIKDFAALAVLKPEALRQILGQRVSLASARDFIAQAKSMAEVNSS
jgi:uncharacterized protein (DUF697 family)/predicted flap endonuclease-1-like 5' DNA nuclease